MSGTRGSLGADTESRLRSVALVLFAHNGYAAFSMRQIAAGVGAQVGALYQYTSDKQTLLFDLMRDHMDELLAARRDAPSGRLPPAHPGSSRAL